MNPYTQFLLRTIHNPWLERFVARWDAFESLAVVIYRQGDCSAEQASAYRQLLQELRATYPDHQDALTPHWRAARIKGQPQLSQDPFLTLLEAGDCSSWIDNRGALKTLPAAREAINRYLLTMAD